MANITPAHEAHETLVSDVERWLRDQGFYTSSFAYHDILGSGSLSAKRLATMHDPMAITVRHRPDRIAYHATIDLAFAWEAKTKGDRAPDNETIYIDLCTLIATWSPDPGQRVLVVHRNQHSGCEVGFWVHGVSGLSQEVRISRAKWAQTGVYGWYEKHARRIFGKGVAIRDHTGGGSGDPYAVIPSVKVAELPHWQTLVTDAMASVSRPSGRRHATPPSARPRLATGAGAHHSPSPHTGGGLSYVLETTCHCCSQSRSADWCSLCVCLMRY